MWCLDEVPGGAAIDLDTVAVIAGDDVARSRIGAADGVVGGATFYDYSAKCVPEVSGTSNIDADVVVLHGISGCPCALDLNAISVAGDDVSPPRRCQ